MALDVPWAGNLSSQRGPQNLGWVVNTAPAGSWAAEIKEEARVAPFDAKLWPVTLGYSVV